MSLLLFCKNIPLKLNFVHSSTGNCILTGDVAINLFDIITQSKINMDNNIQDDKKQRNKKSQLT